MVQGSARRANKRPGTLQAPKLPKNLIFHMEHLVPHRDKHKRSHRAGGSGAHPVPSRYRSLSLIQQRINLNPTDCRKECSHHHRFLHKPY